MLSLLSDTPLLSSRFGSNSKQTVDSPRFHSLNEVQQEIISFLFFLSILLCRVYHPEEPVEPPACRSSYDTSWQLRAGRSPR